ncbi:hypothetical protein Q6D67_14620 [Haliea sp. E1-2-M8]|uniref:anti-sigma factor family protein n=1 Tax=Haliea sp. E1-2-M8 TaxID=3064706 RepID=UPI00271C778E|nr:hypothetical protein [Haliea sp. E1-2-M8]MDO8862940.1 hypothetical protein [Haliea sp. E1-2-M8]
MQDRDFELLSAYVDGELEPAAAAALTSRLAQEPALSARLAELQTLHSELQDAATSDDGTPVPARIRELLQPRPGRIRSLPHRLARFQGNLRQGLAIAASLTAVAGLLLASQWQNGLEGAADDVLLAAALETLPSRAAGWDTLDDGRRLRAVLSFPNKEGSWCREYILADEDSAIRGVACRDSSNWTTRIAVPQALLPGGDEEAYRPASASDSGDFARFIDQHVAGDVAGAESEAGLIAGSWQ